MKYRERKRQSRGQRYKIKALLIYITRQVVGSKSPVLCGGHGSKVI